jgi:hypothetical protein
MWKGIIMASVENVRLELLEVDLGGTARVSYTLRGSADDVQHRQKYRERVELVGVDEGDGEDGTNALLPGGGLVFTRLMTFANTAPLERLRVGHFSADELDEDWGLSGHILELGPGRILRLPKLDEIRARVTLTQIPGRPIVARSGIERRGGAIFAEWL